MRTRTLLILGVTLLLLLSYTPLSSPQKIVVAARSGTYAEGLKYAAKLYEEIFGVKVEVVEFDYAGLHDKLVSEVIEPTGAFDVVMLDDPWLPEFADKGLLVPIKDFFDKLGIPAPDPDFIDSTIEVTKYKGEMYALPYVGNVQLFVYDKLRFAKYGLKEPKTWEDVLEAAKVIKEKEGIAGYVIRGKKGNPVVTNTLPIFWAFGIKVVDEKGNVDIDSEAAVKAMEFIIELKKYAPVGTENYNSPEVKAAIANRQTAMSIVWPAWVPKLNATVWEVTVTPGARPMIGAWLLGVPVSSKNKELAFDFILFVTSRPIQKVLALEVGVPPTRRSVYLDPDVLKKFPWYPVQLKALETSVMRPRIPQWKQVEDILANYIHQALIGAMPPRDALISAAAEIRSVLAG